MDKQEKTESNQPRPKKKKRIKRRTAGQKVLFFTAKWMFIIFCLVISVIFGLVVGYSVIGEGNTTDVFDVQTWKHVFDLVFKS
jgi:cell division protein FtsL